MNITKKLLVSLLGILSLGTISAWDGELVKISKGDRSYGIMVRSYESPEWYHIGKHLDIEGFKPAESAARCFEKKHGNVGETLGDSRSLEIFPTSNAMYHYGKKVVNNTHSFPYVKACDHMTCIFIGEKNNVTDQNDAQHILTVSKEAFKKIAAEDDSVQYEEIIYKNGRPVISPWKRLKNFVWNTKFLYAMSALSALYLGYEYLNQK